MITTTVQITLQGKELKEVWAPSIQKLVDNWGIAILPIQSTQVSISWRPPDMGWVKSNSDGSLSADRAGYGAVLRDHTGKLLTAVAVQDGKLQSINVLEFKAILQGLKMAVAQGISKVNIESDSSTAIAWVHGKGCIPWKAFRVQSELLKILPSFDAWKASHTLREGNQVADYLAGWRGSPSLTIILPQEMSQQLKELVAQDACGTVFARKRSS
ncbi:hypothetical protein QJS10_CPB20g00981 [Acorus calamus]|uniref:RNase H type-1 domain-containing protein n=1 Tax=Acorus calamus TaxID=4465 RepID=A0AAV9CDP9_ACOCL|nr:hypothetical protein QJS10_CPB20g00981 [Acorus calamus]